MNVWPASLPQNVNRSNYQSGLGDGRVRSETDTGIAKLRRRFSAVPRPLACDIKMTAAQLATFTSFVEDDLAGGTLPFQFPAVDGSGTWVLQFGKNMPTWTSQPGDKWLVTLDLVILP